MRIRRDIDRNVIRGRSFDFAKRFLPDGLSKVDRLDSLTTSEQRLLSPETGLCASLSCLRRGIARTMIAVTNRNAPSVIEARPTRVRDASVTFTPSRGVHR
jgi:hypothetical protein